VAATLKPLEKLIEKARRAGKHKSKKEAVTAALQEYIAKQKRLKLLEPMGRIDFDPSYNYKVMRRKRGAW
jgi:uncharacterized tellurite resistance protein B-like protein